VCRLFGMAAGPEPPAATYWLLGAADSLRNQSHREPDGTGLGWFDASGHPHVDKRPLAAYADRAFAQDARKVHATTMVAHIRFASTGGLEPKNTHPFEMHGRLFAHNGVLTGLDLLEAQLGDARELVQGDTDSERLFALITSLIDADGGSVEAGIASAIGWIADNVPVLSLNFILIDAHNLWALRYPETHDLFMLEWTRDNTLVSSHGSRVRTDPRPVVVIATEKMDDDPGWQPLQSGELLHVGADLVPNIARIVDAPPAHPLSVSELSGHAKASQS
jgi:glutamine amidotransferase